MDTELDKVKARIIALSHKTVGQGCSEQEAMSAMSMVGKLLRMYNLSMEECDVRKASCKTVYIDTGRERRGPMDSCVTALTDLFYGIGWFNVKYENGRRKAQYAFYIQDHDAEALQYLYHVIDKAIEYETEQFKGTKIYQAAHPKKSAFVSFQRGMSYRVARRLREIKAENEKEMKEVKRTGTDLVVLKGTVIKQDFNKVHSELKLKKAYTRPTIRNGDSYHAGNAAGDRVNLNRPLNDKSVKGYIK